MIKTSFTWAFQEKTDFALPPKATKISFAISLNYLLFPFCSTYSLHNSGKHLTPSGPLRCRVLEESLRGEEIHGSGLASPSNFWLSSRPSGASSEEEGTEGSQAHLRSQNWVTDRQPCLTPSGQNHAGWCEIGKQQYQDNSCTMQEIKLTPTLSWSQAIKNLPQMWVLQNKGGPWSRHGSHRTPRGWWEMILSRSLILTLPTDGISPSLWDT